MIDQKAQECGVADCYIFKSRLQEFAQKNGFFAPVYQTTKEGPSHEPIFRSAVIVNGIIFESLPGFFSRKAAEQSAAEIALRELAKSGAAGESIYQPLPETGLCKNQLQEYAQRKNYSIPRYECETTSSSSKDASFVCTVEIGGVKYVGAAAKSKKEAEIKAARTALTALQIGMPILAGESQADMPQLTVVPCKKNPSAHPKKDPTDGLKAKRSRFKRNASEKPRRNKVWKERTRNQGVTGELIQPVDEHMSGLREKESSDVSLPDFGVDTVMETRGTDSDCSRHENMGSQAAAATVGLHI